MNNENSFVTK